MKSNHLFVLLLPALIVASVTFISNRSLAQETPAPEEPEVQAASNEGLEAISGFDWPKDELTMQLFAAEPDVANPVAIHIDHQGRVFVCETFRQEVGVEDNREHPEWLNEDLAAQTVADRIAYIRRHEKDAEHEYTKRDDRIRLLRDTNGDGVADSSSVFADRFNRMEMGTGAGVLSWNGSVYYTCIPDLFLLNDKDDDGVADLRTSLHSGFGVRFAFRGHDMHGLIVGPDGRLYFSIGDRGYNVQTPRGTLKDPASGAVFRCEMDGTDLQVIATGLRNPQELAFDDFGNLFTGDNNSDSGDKARWVYVVPGGDSGWRMYYQYLGDRGPFNQEKIWHPDHPETPAYIIPPVDNITDGPSGLAYYPGTGMSEFFDGRFFLCDFRGAAAVSGVRTFRSKQKGAFWEVTDMDQTFWKMLPTDVDFGPDGKLYISDWVFGWVGENRGRIYTLADDTKLAERNEVAELLSNFPSDDPARMRGLLNHRDRRVRQQAQFGLVAVKDGAGHFLAVINSTAETIPRVHALWGLEQIQRKNGNVLEGETYELAKQLLGDPDPEIRAQAAQLIGDTRTTELEPEIRKLLADVDLRVQYFAAMALSRIGGEESIADVAQMAESNTGDDPIVRHGAIMAFAGILGHTSSARLSATVNEILARKELRSRLALLIAVRKMHQPIALLDRVPPEKAAEIGGRIRLDQFLLDENPQVILAAARAIHDVPIEEQLPALAAMIDTKALPPDLPLPVARRVLNANFRIGSDPCAMNLAAFAAREENATEMRVQALEMLRAWAQPPPRDWLLGDWRPLAERDSVFARAALEKYFNQIAAGDNDRVKTAAITTAGSLGVRAATGYFVELIRDENANSESRSEALWSLSKMKHEGLQELIEEFTPDILNVNPDFGGTLCEVAATIDENLAMNLITPVIAPEITPENIRRTQRAIAALGELRGARSEMILKAILNSIRNIPRPIQLDVVDAAARRSPEFDEQLEAIWESMADAENPTAAFAFTLEGGDAEAGEKIFSTKSEVSCVRCHVVDGTGGEVGPDLSAIALTRDRQYLLESIIVPNKDIADGFTEQVILTDEGETLVGIVTDEDEENIRMVDSEGIVTLIPVESVEGRREGKSSMPENLVEQLTQAEIRDLIEFLAKRTQAAKPEDNEGGHGE